MERLLHRRRFYQDGGDWLVKISRREDSGGCVSDSKPLRAEAEAVVESQALAEKKDSCPRPWAAWGGTEFRTRQCSVEPEAKDCSSLGLGRQGGWGRESHDAEDTLAEEESSGGKIGGGNRSS